jgi:hypothetical protein
VLAENQLTSLSGQGTLWPTVVESALDYLTMISQQLQNTIGNFFQAPSTDPPGLNYTTGAAAQRANQALGFDGSGNLTTFTVLPAGTVSSAMAPVVNASSIPNARTALGLGAMATEGIGAGLQDDGASNARVIFTTNAFGISTAITSANYLQKLKLTGPLTLTLPRANTLWNGFGFWIEVLPQSSGPVTVAINAADQIENGASGVSLIVPVGWNLFIATNAAASGTWWVEQTPGTLVNSTPAGVYAGGLSVDVTSTTAITASVGSVSVTDGQNFWTVTPSGGIATGTVGVGGVDVGPIVINSWYAVWVIYNPIGRVANWILSLQTTLTGLQLHLPSGYTAGALLGMVRSGSAGLLGTNQRGNCVDYIPGLAGTTPGVPQIASGSQTNLSVSLASVIPPNTKTYKAYIAATAIGVAVENQVSLAPASYGALSSTTNPPPLTLGNQQSGTVGFAAVATQGTFIGTGPVVYNSTWGAGSGAFIQGFELNL